MVKNLPAMQETWVRSLGQEDPGFPGGPSGKESACHCNKMQERLVQFLSRKDPLEKAMEIHSSVLTWRIPWIEEVDRLQFIGHPESDTTEVS